MEKRERKQKNYALAGDKKLTMWLSIIGDKYLPVKVFFTFCFNLSLFSKRERERQATNELNYFLISVTDIELSMYIVVEVMKSLSYLLTSEMIKVC